MEHNVFQRLIIEITLVAVHQVTLVVTVSKILMSALLPLVLVEMVPCVRTLMGHTYVIVSGDMMARTVM
jgi:hypothetical protein